MKKLIIITIAVVFIFLIPTSTVFAGRSIELTSSGLHFGNGYGHRQRQRHKHHGHHRHRNRGFRAPHSYDVIPKHSNHKIKPRIFRNTYSNRDPIHSYRGKSCRPVYKFSYDSYGRRRKIGGTMCYDANGAGYVVPGSRYVTQ